MHIGIIGANGRLGSKITTQALDRGYEVTGFVYEGKCLDDRAATVVKDLFALTPEDLSSVDVLISAFGGGFNTDPVINKKAFEQYINLLNNTDKKLITIGGAGSLYTDDTHTMFEYQSESHPNKLKEISKNIKEGIDIIKEVDTMAWIVVCPSRSFDFEGPFTREYIIGDKQEIIYNEDNNSYVSYANLACAMLDNIDSDQYDHKVITVASRKG